MLQQFRLCNTTTVSENGLTDVVIPHEVLDVDPEQSIQRPAPIRSPSISLSGYTFEVSKELTEHASALPPAESVKKPRKRQQKSTVQRAEAPPKKPRKRKKKSESIILNSDEPDPANVPTSNLAHEFEAPLCDSNVLDRQNHSADKKTKKRQTKPARIAPPPQIETNKHASSLKDDSNIAAIEVAALEQSAYFSNRTVSDVRPIENKVDKDLTLETLAIPSAASGEAAAEHITTMTDVTSRRRRSWTPAKDTATGLGPRPLTAGSEISISSTTPKLQLKDILRGFGYVSLDNEGSIAAERTATGEAATKRRRIDFDTPVTGSTVVRNETAARTPAARKATKGPKQPKKKAQTITALATAAFQPIKQAQAEDSTVSHPSEASKNAQLNEAVPAERPQTISAKPKRVRKPNGAPKAQEAQKTKPAKISKAAKSKVHFSETNYLSKLYSPKRANARLDQQDLLFGTSSQLAVDESATFIRDMQVAVRESEAVPEPRYGGAYSSQIPPSQASASPQGKSYVKIPVAPHGTSFALNPKEREFWCAASRNFHGTLFRSEKQKTRQMEVTADDIAPRKIIAEDMVTALEATKGESVNAVRGQAELVPNPFPAAAHKEVDIVEDLQQVGDTRADEPPPAVATHEMAPVPGPPASNEADDSWMLISSDSPPVEPLPPSCQPLSKHAPTKSTLSKFLSPPRTRPPLSPLNPNPIVYAGAIDEKHSAVTHYRAFSSTTTTKARKPESPTRKAVRDPGEEAKLCSPTPGMPKRRGRPPKQKPIPSDPSPQITKSKKQRIGTSASQPTPQTEWLDIDEIYDSDSPSTPSPPRRRATSSPPAVQPLTLSPAGSPSTRPTVPTVSTSAAPALKPTDSNFSSIRTTLFPRITSTVKSAPRSTDSSKPSWWEKILLYDPIVLEDLTSWLNEQGLRVEVKKQKPKLKKRGRKRKDVEVEDDEVEWEFHEQPLQPWMVQKWCEEKSICCLWKEGLRGGVRTRY